MPTYYDSQNNAHVLGERLGSGGEGTVYLCDETAATVAKIYHEPIKEEKAEKLRWMAANKNEQLLKASAWVIDVLTDAPDGRAVGFLMPNVKAKEIHELYSLKSRRVYFPEATWHFLVHTAANVARAFHNLHRNAHVMGDVNHGNCVVLADGTVKLIDCDSYSIKTDKMRYRCEVGVATHLAPELQGVNLHDAERLDKHDNFGLAVIIFQLLFLGRHPFAGNYLGAEDKSLEDCIREYRFAYGDNAEIKNVKQPPGTLPLAAVSPRVALMFERAFLTEDRPEPREWIEALEDLSNNLEQCSLHPGHLYFNGLGACPWCEIEGQTGLMLFPFVTSGNHPGGEKPFNIFTVENLIASLGISNNLPAKLPKPAEVLPPPSNEVLEAKKNNFRRLLIVVTVHFFSLIFLMAIFGGGWAFFMGILLMLVLMIYFNDSSKYLRQELNENLADAQAKLENLEIKWTQTAGAQNLDNDLLQIRQKLQAHQQIQQQSRRQLKLLQADFARRETFAHLRSQAISKTKISGVDEQLRRTLVGKGVKTAAEIEESRLRGLGEIEDATITNLLEWRKKLETDFIGSAQTTKILETEKTRFIDETTRERRGIEREIERLLMILRAGSVHLHKQRQQLVSKSEELVKHLLQTKSDSQSLGDNTPAIAALLFITLLTPLTGAFISSGTSVIVDYPQTNTYSGISSSAPFPKTTSYSKADLEVPDEKITDAEIEALPSPTRELFAENLNAQALDDNYGKLDYREAERKMRLAVRLKGDDTRFLNQLGYALCMQQKYAESLSILTRSLKIDGANSGTKIFIGINYLQTKKFNAARKILTEVTDQYSNSFEGFYNLGLAYVGLKKYDLAFVAFHAAAKINPYDADAHYEIGYCAYKLSNKEETRRQYSILLNLDKTVAEQLKKETNLVVGSNNSPDLAVD
jgi:DNA-binding helix-hairpin-helix protein with protein kinase domain/Flp pilus assembly protein TadD